MRSSPTSAGSSANWPWRWADRSGLPGSDLERVERVGDDDRGVDEGLERGGEGFEALGLAVDAEGLVDPAADLLEPPGQVVLVGVAGEAVEDVDGRVQVVPVVHDLDPLGP